MIVLKTTIDTFICDWKGNRPWYLVRDSSVECLGNSHFLYMILILIGVG